MVFSRPFALNEIPVLLRGETGQLTSWLQEAWARRVAFHLALILFGAGVYGAVIGWWRAPLQALFTAVKFPLIVLLTSAGNALINSMLAPLLGLSITFRQSFLAVLMSFAIMATVLAAFSPLVLFLICNLPPMDDAAKTIPFSYSFLMLSQVGIIAFAGVAGNVRLVQLLCELSGSQTVARNVCFSWLGVNLLLGSQLTWILRPFFGSPHLAVQFLRSNAFEGNFFETIFYSVKYLLGA